MSTKGNALKNTNNDVIADGIMSPELINNLQASGTKKVYTTDDTLAFGDVVYFKASGNVGIANATTGTTMGVVAMCVDATITAGNAGNFLTLGYARNDAWNWLTVAGSLFVSITGTTGNTLVQSPVSGSAKVSQTIGQALSATTIYFNPNRSKIMLI